MKQRLLAHLAALVLLVSPVLAPAATPPQIRVGLVEGAREALIEATEGLLRLETGDGEAALLEGPQRFAVRAPEPASPAAPSTWFIDIQQESDPRQAERVAKALKSSVKAPLAVEDRGGVHVVVAGPFSAREPAAELQAFFASAGMAEAALREVREKPVRRSRLVSVNADWEVSPIDAERAVLSTKSGELLLNGRPYRGVLRLSLDGKGLLRVVNALPLEAYLRGVVPEELGPASFSEVEALAAQAVAARTWVLTQLGRHEAEGYDVCPTAHCQVYGGAGSEHELSDRAVFETVGRVLAHEGEPATAYFSSTCGGRTEAVENVFAHPPVPYLRGVTCYPESVAFTNLAGRALQADWSRVDGRPAHDLLARLWAVGLVGDSELVAGGFDRRAKSDEAADWLRRAAALAGAALDAAALERLDVGSALGFLETLEAALGWKPRAALLEAADLAAAAHFAELEGLDGADLRTALLAQKGGLLPPGVSAGWAEGKMSRGNVLEVLSLWLESRGLFEVEAVRYLGREGSDLVVLASGERERRSLSEGPVLLSGRKGRLPAPLETLDLKLSDKLRLHGPPGGPAKLVVLEEDPDGAAYDRTSAFSWWERRTPFADVAREAKGRAGVDRLTDVEVKRVSPAGRVVAVELTDAKGRKTLLEGFPARGLLGLPDARAHVEIERASDGRPVAVRATGRGWGHGVGLCQFGAYGMALSGYDHEQILAHYFPGAPLRDLRDLRLPASPR